MTPTVPPRVARVSCEEAFGERLRDWITQSKVPFVEVARALGIQRSDLYEVMDGDKHAHAAWMECLPPAVERLFLAERAHEHGLELRDVSPPEKEATLTDIVFTLSGAMVAAAAGEADGVVTQAEAQAEFDQWWLVETMMKARKARLRAAGAR